MELMKMRCDGGCHGQVGVKIGIVQIEAAYALDKLIFGARAEVHKARLGLSVTVFFGPFQIAAGLMLLKGSAPT